MKYRGHLCVVKNKVCWGLILRGIYREQRRQTDYSITPSEAAKKDNENSAASDLSGLKT